MKKGLLLLLFLVLIPVASLAETVVTSFYPIWLFTLNLTDGIDGLEVRNLAAPDTGCLHDYQLQTGDMKVLATADLFVVNGAGMESYLDLVFESFPDLPVAQAAAGLPLLYDNSAIQIGEKEEEGLPNAHVWLSVPNASHMVDQIAAALTARFPQYADSIEANRAAYVSRLASLDERMREMLSGLPRRGIVTFHEAFPYFAEAYGFQVLAVVNREPGETLSPAQLAALVDVIRNLGLPPLFVEPQYEDLSARTLAAETGARVYTLDPVVTGPENEVPLDYYETVMLKNAETLTVALGE